MDFLATLHDTFRQLSQKTTGTRYDAFFLAKLPEILAAIDRGLTLEPDLDGLPRCPVFCDYHPGNHKWVDEHSVGLFDFDWTKLDYRVFDIAVGFVYFCSSWEGPDDGQLRLDKVGIFLRAYQDEAARFDAPGSLTEAELAALPRMIAIAGLYVVNWDIVAYYNDRRPNDDEYLFFLEHNVAFVEFIEDHIGRAGRAGGGRRRRGARRDRRARRGDRGRRRRRRRVIGMTYAELLTPAEVERLHEASLAVLESVGILAHHAGAREVFRRHGCAVDEATGLVKFPSEVVERYRKLAPPNFTFRGRDPRFDRTIPDDGPIVVTGSSAPNVVDPVTGVERRATSADIAQIAYLINELPGFDVFSISTLAADAPEGQLSLSRFYPALKNCLKPVRSNTPTMDDLHQVIELGELIVGGRDAYRERPSSTTTTAPW